MKVKKVELEKKTEDEEVKSNTRPLELDTEKTSLTIVYKAIQARASIHRAPIHLADVQKSEP